MSDATTMNTSDLEKIKRYILYADRQQRTRRQPAANWWIVYGVFWLATFVLLLIWMSDNYASVGPWWTLVMVIAFIIFHLVAVWGIYRASRTTWFRPADVIKELRYNYSNPKVGQICSAIMGSTDGFKFPASSPATSAWQSDMRPIYRITAVSSEKMLTLQLIRTADQEALGKALRDVPYNEVEAIET